MKSTFRKALAIGSLAAGAFALPAFAQTDPHQHDAPGAPAGKGPQGMMGEHGMMMDMMQNCRRMMSQGGGSRGMLPRLPEGNEKLELQMHADMMKAMGDILAKYAARLPEKK